MGIEDVYYRQPWTPGGEQLQRQDKAFGSLPGLAEQGQRMQMNQMQMKQQQQMMDRDNEPIPPELQALFAKTATDMGRPDLAAKYGGGMGGGNGQVGPQGTGMERPVQSQGMLSSGMDAGPRMQNMGQGGGGGMDSVAVQMPQPMQRPQPQSEQLTRRRFNEFMGGASGVANQERALAGAEATTKITADARRDVAKEKMELDWAKLDETSKANYLKDLRENKKIDNKTEQAAASIELGYARIQASERKWQSAKTNKDRLEILDSMLGEIKSLEGEVNGLTKDFKTMLANPRLRARYETLVEELNEKKGVYKQYRDFLASNLDAQPSTSEGESRTGPAGMKPPVEVPQETPPIPGSPPVEAPRPAPVQATPKAAPAKAKAKYTVGQTVDMGGGKKGKVTGYNSVTKKWKVVPL